MSGLLSRYYLVLDYMSLSRTSFKDTINNYTPNALNCYISKIESMNF